MSEDEVAAWFASVERSLPVATFRHEETSGEAFTRHRDEGPRACCRCGGEATTVFLSAGEIGRWVDVCAPCAHWIKGDA